MPTLRLYSVYGPYEEPSRLMPTLIVHALAGKLPRLADPETTRDYVYVDDVCEAYLMAATRTSDDFGAIYNVGTGTQISLRELVERVSRTLDVVAEPRWGSMPGRSWDTRVWVAQTRKIRSELGWRPRHTVDQGIRETVRWFQSHPQALHWYRDPSSSSDPARRSPGPGADSGISAS